MNVFPYAVATCSEDNLQAIQEMESYQHHTLVYELRETKEMLKQVCCLTTMIYLHLNCISILFLFV